MIDQNRWHRASMKAVWFFGHDLHLFASESFKNIRTIRSYSKEPAMKHHYDHIRDEMHRRKMKGALMSAVNTTVRSWFDLASKTLILWAGGLLVFQHLQRQQDGDVISNGSLSASDLLTLGELITFERYWNKLKSSIFSVQRQVQQFEKACFMSRHIFRLLDATPIIEYVENTDSAENRVDETAKVNGVNDVNISQRITVQDVEGDIIFNDVHYVYGIEPNKKVLKGIDLVIPKGQTTAFVGRSGGGKTTLVNLLLRFYDPTEGAITVDGVDLREMDVYSWRSLIGMVSQSTEIFSGSIAHNIAFGVDEYTIEDIEKCAKLANAHHFITEFDDGYLTKIGSGGTTLSGGQRQRVSIARMLMKKPRLMVLDEATSSLDAESEALVQAALEMAIEDQESTVVLVAHRLSTVVNADQIVVVDDGRVIECGTHLELVERNGLYAKLVDRQLNLQIKMKEKVKRIRTEDGTESDKKRDGEGDADNIDKLIEQIRKENQIDIGRKT